MSTSSRESWFNNITSNNFCNSLADLRVGYSHLQGGTFYASSIIISVIQYSSCSQCPVFLFRFSSSSFRFLQARAYYAPGAYFKARNTGTRNNRTRNTPAEQWNTGGHQWNTDGTPEHWRNNGTQEGQSKYLGIAEQINTSGTTEQQKQHQEILPMQNNDILSRYHNRIQNKKVI